MANTLSSIGGVLHDSRANELIVICKAPGTIGKAGETCGILATGVFSTTDVDGSLDNLVGIILPAYHTDMDTVIAINKIVEVVVPTAGHLYGVRIETIDDTAMGDPLIFHATEPGALDVGTSIEAEHVARTYRTAAAADNWGIVIWGA
ncbi:hypothetical protein KA005_71100 [bacterium]|nr:hypothetical protein [bacterium]